jgi:hypothetical protein
VKSIDVVCVIFSGLQIDYHDLFFREP